MYIHQKNISGSQAHNSRQVVGGNSQSFAACSAFDNANVVIGVMHVRVVGRRFDVIWAALASHVQRNTCDLPIKGLTERILNINTDEIVRLL